MGLRNRIMIVDSSSVMHGAKHSQGKSISRMTRNTFVIFGFLIKLQYLMQRIQPDVVVFANDIGGSFRREIYPEYKETRRTKEKTPKELEIDKLAYEQFAKIRDYVIPELGFRNNFAVKGLEADDIIGRICYDYRDESEAIFIVTTDNDMLQLLSPNTSMFITNTNKFYSIQDFRDEYGIEPKMWKRVKVMAGCVSDNVKGIPGVGPDTVIKYIKGELPRHYKKYQSIISEDSKAIIERNKKLVIIPFKGTPKFKIKPDHVSRKKLLEIAKEFKFHSITKDINTWAKNLRAR